MSDEIEKVKDVVINLLQNNTVKSASFLWGSREIGYSYGEFEEELTKELEINIKLILS